MALTNQEIRAIMEMTNYYERPAWGHKDKGMWPALVVAQLRGARVRTDAEGWLTPDPPEIGFGALADVACYLSLSHQEYLDLLVYEGANFLRRFITKQADRR